MSDEFELYLSDHDVVTAREDGVRIVIGWDDYYGSEVELTWGQATALSEWMVKARERFGLTENVR